MFYIELHGGGKYCMKTRIVLTVSKLNFLKLQLRMFSSFEVPDVIHGPDILTYDHKILLVV